MSSASSSHDVHLCGRRLDHARHVCAFVTSSDEEYGILGPYVKEGADQGERLINIIDGTRRGDHMARLRKAGVDADKLVESGDLSVLAWEEAHLQGGYFDSQRMIDTLKAAVDDRRRRGYALLRGIGNMDWVLRGAPGTEQLLEYETRLNFMAEGNPDVFVCTYHVDRFPSSVLFDVMRTHPACIIGGVYHENPFFVPPEQMLQELVARGKAKRA